MTATLLDAQGREVPIRERVTEVYVICDRGVPVVACVDMDTARALLVEHDPKTTRIHHVRLAS